MAIYGLMQFFGDKRDVRVILKWLISNFFFRKTIFSCILESIKWWFWNLKITLEFYYPYYLKFAKVFHHKPHLPMFQCYTVLWAAFTILISDSAATKRKMRSTRLCKDLFLFLHFLSSFCPRHQFSQRIYQTHKITLN